MAELSLQALFRHVFLTQSFIQQLQVAEDMITDVSDHLDEHEVPHEDIYVGLRAGIRQMRVHLNFVLAVQLLDAGRQIEQYLRLHGRLPRLDLNFQWERDATWSIDFL